MDDFLPLNRKIMKHWLWDDKPFSKGQAWIDLLMLANYTEKKKPKNGEIILYKRGNVNLSMTQLAGRWGWDRRTVKRFLDLLSNDNMVSIECTTHGTTITIVNYEVFNNSCTTNGTTDSTTNAQQDVQPMVQPIVQQMPTTNKDNNDKKEKETKKGKKEDNMQMLNRLLPNYPLSESLSDKIREWIEYKVDRKETYVERGMNSLIKKISENAQKSGDFAVMDLIDVCMANNWKGIIWDKLEIKKVNNQRNNINATKQSQLEYLLNSIREDEMNEYNGG